MVVASVAAFGGNSIKKPFQIRCEGIFRFRQASFLTIVGNVAAFGGKTILRKFVNFLL